MYLLTNYIYIAKYMIRKLPVRRLTLRQLKVFETVARLSGFNRAAEELHLAQPTVSLQVRQLADIIDMPLYEQIGKKIYITEAGALVQAAAGEVFGAFERLEMQLAQLKGLTAGRLKVAVVTTAKYFIPRLLGPFTRHYPGIEIALDVGNRSEIVARLARNEDDLYIMGMPPAGMDIRQHSFIENPSWPLRRTGTRWPENARSAWLDWRRNRSCCASRGRAPAWRASASSSLMA